MMFGPRFLAIDWGTTNRRIFRIEDGRVVATERDAKGVTAVSDFAAEAAAIRAAFGDLPMLLAGMVGSNIGWQAVPYVAAPAGVAEIAGGLLWIDARTAIVPGISTLAQGRADVMRGEEVQLLGAVAAGLVPPDSLLAQPGTHCKWAEMADGRVADFTTAMTGELFALLRSHGLLAAQLGGEVTPGAAFLEGVAEGARGDLAASLFGIRAAKMLGRRDDSDAPSYCSGLLIGADVAARIARTGHDCIHILADPALGALYAAAVESHGKRTQLVDSHAAFVAGILEIGKHIA
ncbi:2-dehydro-3-deoxygalactonokinase [Sphingomonas sp. CJ20]